MDVAVQAAVLHADAAVQVAAPFPPKVDADVGADLQPLHVPAAQARFQGVLQQHLPQAAVKAATLSQPLAKTPQTRVRVTDKFCRDPEFYKRLAEEDEKIRRSLANSSFK